MPRHRRGWAMGNESDRSGRHSPLTVSMLEPALLILLKNRSQHGYTLLADLQAYGMQTIHPSVVYRTLRDLEMLEWVNSDWDRDQTQGPPRRIYSLTSQGEIALQNWRAEMDKTRNLITILLDQLDLHERRKDAS